MGSFLRNELKGIRAAVDAGAENNQKLGSYAGFAIEIAADDPYLLPCLELLI